MKRTILALSSIAFLTLSAYSQTDSGYAFTLAEAQEFAVQNNLTVKNAQLDIEAAKKKVWETTSIGLPQVSGSFDYQYIPGEIPSFNFAEGFIPILEQLNGLHPGEFDETIEGMRNASSPIAVRSSATYGITVSQLVFSGEYIVGLQASRTYKQLSQNSYEKSVLDIKETVSSTYYSILVLESNVAMLDTSITNLNELFSQYKAMKNQGFVEQTDVDQIELNMRSTSNTKKSLENQLGILYRLLNIQLGLEVSDSVILKDNLASIMGITLNTNNEYDLSNNIDVQMLQTQEKISQLSLNREKSTFLPTVSAFYSYTDKTEKAAIDFTMNHLIGVSVSVPIFSSGQRLSKVQQAKIELEKSKNNLELISENTETQIQQTQNNLLVNYDKYLNEKMNVKLSKRIYDKTNLKYKEGMASSMELTQAHNQYLLTYSNYTNAILEFLNTQLALKKLYNNL